MKSYWGMSRLVSPHGDAHFRRISRTRFVAAGFFSSSSRWPCVCWLRLLRNCACVCACIRAWESRISGHLWKQLGSFGSNDSGSPQHLATALSVCVLWNTAHLCVLELGQDKWVGDILFAHEKVINKKLGLTTGARSVQSIGWWPCSVSNLSGQTTEKWTVKLWAFFSVLLQSWSSLLFKIHWYTV